MKKENILEKSVQEALERYYWTENYITKREVHTPVGYIDFILYKPNEKILIEVKEYKSIKHAIGQIYSYKKYHQDITEARIVYFCRDGKYRPIDNSYLTHDTNLDKNIDNKKIRMQCVHTFIELEEIYKWQNILTISKRNQESSQSLKTSSIEMISPVVISDDISNQIKIVKDESSYSKVITTITDMKLLPTIVNQQEYILNPITQEKIDTSQKIEQELEQLKMIQSIHNLVW